MIHDIIKLIQKYIRESELRAFAKKKVGIFHGSCFCLFFGAFFFSRGTMCNDTKRSRYLVLTVSLYDDRTACIILRVDKKNPEIRVEAWLRNKARVQMPDQVRFGVRETTAIPMPSIGFVNNGCRIYEKVLPTNSSISDICVQNVKSFVS